MLCKRGPTISIPACAVPCWPQIARGDINNAATAITSAFTLSGGAGPALATVRQLGRIVQSVGCTGPMADSLRSELLHSCLHGCMALFKRAMRFTV